MLNLAHRHPLKDVMTKYGLLNIITEPTRVGHSSCTLLDPILLTDTICSKSSYVIDVDRSVSDHNAAVCHLHVPVKLCTTFKGNVWLYKKGNFNKFNELLSDFDWLYFFSNCFDVNDA